MDGKEYVRGYNCYVFLYVVLNQIAYKWKVMQICNYANRWEKKQKFISSKNLIEKGNIF